MSHVICRTVMSSFPSHMPFDPRVRISLPLGRYQPRQRNRWPGESLRRLGSSCAPAQKNGPPAACGLHGMAAVGRPLHPCRAAATASVRRTLDRSRRDYVVLAPIAGTLRPVQPGAVEFMHLEAATAPGLKDVNDSPHYSTLFLRPRIGPPTRAVGWIAQTVARGVRNAYRPLGLSRWASSHAAPREETGQSPAGSRGRRGSAL